MTLTIPNRTFVFAGLFALCAIARAQYQPPPPALTTAPCKATRKNPCAAAPADVRPAEAVNPFPFPGETTGEVPDIPGSHAQPEPPSKPSGKGTGTEAGNQTTDGFPFPGEPVESGTGSSSSTSSSATDSGEAAPNALKDEGSTGSTRFARKHLAKIEDPDTRVSKDLEVARYYVSTGNFQAAYRRAKDAVSTIPDDPAAHLALAQTAQRLNKKEEAIAEYKVYIKLEPDGNKVPSARKALALLNEN